MGYQINKVEWDRQKDQLQQIREKVFVYELHIPKRIEFDSQKFAIDSDFRAHGVFGVKFYTIYLKSVS